MRKRSYKLQMTHINYDYFQIFIQRLLYRIICKINSSIGSNSNGVQLRVQYKNIKLEYASPNYQGAGKRPQPRKKIV